MENSGVIRVKEKERGKLENPFTLKVGQVFTGFGLGCGFGVGVGRPLNLGAIPVLNQVMVATRGATDAFSGLQRHVNSSLRKVGANNIEVGIGCGVGFGHGFGVGVAVKPRVLHQIQLQAYQALTAAMARLGMGSTLSLDQSILPASLQTGMSALREPSNKSSDENIVQSVKSVSNNPYEVNTVSSENAAGPKSATVNKQYGSRTEAVINKLLKNPLLKEDESSPLEQTVQHQLDTHVLQMVLKHQIAIEELIKENEKLRQILMKELKIQPIELRSTSTRYSDNCTECFECRRRQRKR